MQPRSKQALVFAQVRVVHAQLHWPVRLGRLPYLGRFVGLDVARLN